MTTVTGLTAERMIAIEGASVIGGEIDGDDLILTKFDESTVNAGNVRGPRGYTGAAGLPAFAIPGQMIMWPGDTLPDDEIYGIWTWADGSAYLIADHPIAAAHISDEWRTFDGAADPGITYFRVPDMRGVTPAGMDTMPGGAAANRVARTEADDIAGITGEETHVITLDEIPAHTHEFTDPGHSHQIFTLGGQTGGNTDYKVPAVGIDPQFDRQDFTDANDDPYVYMDESETGITISSNGNDDPHENMQPTVFVPYIVCLDG